MIKIGKSYMKDLSAELLNAVRQGQVNTVKQLIEAGADVNALDGLRDSALHIAASNNNVELIKLLIENGANVKAVDVQGDSALHIAANNNNPQLIKLLIDNGANVNAPNLRMDRPLAKAISQGHNEAAFQLITAGANLNIIVKKVDPVVMLDGNGRRVERSKDLIWDYEYESYVKELSPLMYAINEKNVDLALELIRAGANVNAIDALGDSALHFAVRKKLTELFKPLIKAGADINLINEKGESPISIAENTEKQKLEEALSKISEQKKAEHNQPKARKKTVKQRSGSPTSIADSINSADSKARTANKNRNTKPKNGKAGKQPVNNQTEKLQININLTQEAMNAMLVEAVDKGDINKTSELIKQGADVNHKENTIPILNRAIARGNLEVISLLIDAGADINRANVLGYSPLMIAIIEGKREIASMLIKAGADVNAVNQDGYSALYFATQKGNKELTDLFIEKEVNANAESKQNLTQEAVKETQEVVNKESMNAMLVEAVDKGDINKTLELIKQGADVNHKENTIPILNRAIARGNLEVISLLIDAGADINRANVLGYSPLMIAIIEGKREIASMLIKAGADVNAVNQDGYSALYFATQKGNKELTDLFIEKEVNANAESKQNLTQEAVKGTQEVVNKESMNAMLVEAVDKGDINKISELIKQGVNINHKDAKGYSPLMYAITLGNKQSALKLIEAGADVNILAEKTGDSALLLALQGYNDENLHKNYKLLQPTQRADIVLALINKGADVNILNKKGETPLSFANMLNVREPKNPRFNQIFSLLKEKGANIYHNDNTSLMFAINREDKDEALKIMIDDKNLDINHKNRDGDTAFTLALKKGYTEIAAQLIGRELSEEALNQPNKDKETPLTLALKNGATEIADELIEIGNHQEIINHKNKEGDTALTLALKKGYVELSEDLIKLGLPADIGSHKNEDGHTALYIALKNSKTDIAEKLIPMGIPSEIINEQDSSGNTLLHYAKTSSVYSMLIEAGADPKIKNNNGEVAYDRLSWMSRFSVWINDIYKEYFKPKGVTKVLNSDPKNNKSETSSLNAVKLSFISEKMQDHNDALSTTANEMKKGGEVNTKPEINITEPAMKELYAKNAPEEQEKHGNIERQ